MGSAWIKNVISSCVTLFNEGYYEVAQTSQVVTVSNNQAKVIFNISVHVHENSPYPACADQRLMVQTYHQSNTTNVTTHLDQLIEESNPTVNLIYSVIVPSKQSLVANIIILGKEGLPENVYPHNFSKFIINVSKYERREQPHFASQICC